MLKFFKNKPLKNSHLTQIINQINDSIISTDLEGYIVSWNKGSTYLYGYKEEEILGKHIALLYKPAELKNFKSSITRVLENEFFEGEVEVITKSKTVKFVSLTLSILKDDKGKPLYIVGYGHDISEKKRIEKKLAYQASHDALTQLPNRTLLHQSIRQSISKARRNQTKLAIFFIDLDKFKQINDSLGHGIGDKVLQEAAFRIKSVLREEDTLARLGGDEFTVIMEELKQTENASILAQRILAVLVQPIIIGHHTLYISCSIGISIYPQDHKKIDKLIMYADTAMYKAKEIGRNNFQFYSPFMTQIALEKITVETQLREAIQHKEFVVYYQPQIDGRNNDIVGIEALIRWQHPTDGLLSPIKFIPIAVDSGLIVEIDRWIMKEAMIQIKEWVDEKLFKGKLALNLAIKHLYEKDFLTTLKQNILLTEFNYSWLELEVSESEIMHNPQSAIEILTQISNLGIEISIDDFGTGYSSLSYLKKLPIDKLKIDKSFIQELPHDEEDAGITKAVIALAKSLKIDLIAEGVETIEQKDFLIENKCDMIQGYLYAKPLPAHEMKEFLEKHA